MTSSLKEVLKKLSADEEHIVISTLERLQTNKEVESFAVNNLNAQLTGRTFSRKEKLELEMESLFRYFERRRELLAGALTATQVAKLLGTSRQTPHDRMKSQTLLGILDNGVYRFPAWQFDPSGSDGVIEGFPEVLRMLKVSDFAKLNWLMRANPFLDHLTPIEALKQGQKERVIEQAASVGVQ